MVYTNTQRHATLSALVDKRLKLTTFGAVVTRVYAHFVDIVGSDRCYLRHKVYIGNNGCVVAITTQRGHNLGKGLALLFTLRREANNRSTRICYALDLSHRCSNICRCSVGHRLYGNGVVATNLCRADSNLQALSTRKFCQIHIKSVVQTTKIGNFY